MDECSNYILEELSKKGLTIKAVAEKSGIDYMQLYYSLSGKRDRPLRATEYLKICRVLELDANGAEKQ